MKSRSLNQLISLFLTPDLNEVNVLKKKFSLFSSRSNCTIKCLMRMSQSARLPLNRWKQANLLELKTFQMNFSIWLELPLRDLLHLNSLCLLQTEEDSSSSIEKQVAETVKRAFWDAFAAKISQDPPDFTMAYVMLEELKETLVGILLPQHQRLKDQINEVLDMPLIKQQMEQRVFDFEYYGRYVTDTMARLCAPARDEKIAEIRTIQDVVPKFKAIMETLELMRRDMANFTIKQIRPYIQQNSIDYERKKFSEYYETQKALGVNPLKYTEVWLKRNFEKLVQSTGQNLTSSSTTSTPTPATVLNEAYIEVLEWSDPNNFPETLMLDQLRFMALRDKLHTLGLITSVQLITYSVVGSPVEGVEDLKQKLRDHVDLLLQDVAQK
ncbi:T-complex protein 11-like protein 1 [Biomphalaria glabrata]